MRNYSPISETPSSLPAPLRRVMILFGRDEILTCLVDISLQVSILRLQNLPGTILCQLRIDAMKTSQSTTPVNPESAGNASTGGDEVTNSTPPIAPTKPSRWPFLALVVVLLLSAIQIYREREYWGKALAEGTLFPKTELTSGKHLMHSRQSTQLPQPVTPVPPQQSNSPQNSAQKKSS